MARHWLSPSTERGCYNSEISRLFILALSLPPRCWCWEDMPLLVQQIIKKALMAQAMTFKAVNLWLLSHGFMLKPSHQALLQRLCHMLEFGPGRGCRRSQTDSGTSSWPSLGVYYSEASEMLWSLDRETPMEQYLPTGLWGLGDEFSTSWSCYYLEMWLAKSGVCYLQYSLQPHTHYATAEQRPEGKGMHQQLQVMCSYESLATAMLMRVPEVDGRFIHWFKTVGSYWGAILVIPSFSIKQLTTQLAKIQGLENAMDKA